MSQNFLLKHQLAYLKVGSMAYVGVQENNNNILDTNL